MKKYIRRLRDAVPHVDGYCILRSIMNANEWINLDRTVTSSKRYYAHFDLRTDIGQQKEYILSADKVAAHSFYPFIHYKHG